MDNSSRNIVKFIITITFAALLIMGARFYAESQKEPMPEVAASDENAAPAEPVVEEGLDETPVDPEAPEDELIEEDAELIMGEPSMNLEQGGTQEYTPPAQPQPQPPVEAPPAE